MPRSPSDAALGSAPADSAGAPAALAAARPRLRSTLPTCSPAPVGGWAASSRTAQRSFPLSRAPACRVSRLSRECCPLHPAVRSTPDKPHTTHSSLEPPTRRCARSSPRSSASSPGTRSSSPPVSDEPTTTAAWHPPACAPSTRGAPLSSAPPAPTQCSDGSPAVAQTALRSPPATTPGNRRTTPRSGSHHSIHPTAHDGRTAQTGATARQSPAPQPATAPPGSTRSSAPAPPTPGSAPPGSPAARLTPGPADPGSHTPSAPQHAAPAPTAPADPLQSKTASVTSHAATSPAPAPPGTAPAPISPAPQS